MHTHPHPCTAAEMSPGAHMLSRTCNRASTSLLDATARTCLLRSLQHSPETRARTFAAAWCNVRVSCAHFSAKAGEIRHLFSLSIRASCVYFSHCPRNTSSFHVIFNCPPPPPPPPTPTPRPAAQFYTEYTRDSSRFNNTLESRSGSRQ